MLSFKSYFTLFSVCTILLSCGIEPVAWLPSSKPLFEGKIALNNRLSNVESISLQGYYGAEEFVVDSTGVIYCGVHKGPKDYSSGAILKIYPDNKVETYIKTDAWVTGMQFDSSGNLIALLNNVGLIKVNADKSIDTLLTHTPDDKPLLMGTGLKIGKDGKIYFVNTSGQEASSSKYISKLILEMKPTGGIYAFDPITKSTEIISNGNFFGNGLVLSNNEDFLLVSETSKYRLLRYWLKGTKKGTSEIFMDNLPGFPNNLSRSTSGNFWLGFTTKRNDQLDAIHPKIGMKKFVYNLPEFVQPKAEKFGMVFEISEQGEIIQTLFDPTGEQVSEAGSILEHNGYLYLGGDVVAAVSKMKL